MLFRKWSGIIRHMVAHPAALLPALPTFLILVAITILSFEAVDLFYKIISLAAVNQSAAAKNTFSSKPFTDIALRGPLQNYGVITERNLFQSTLKTISEKQLGDGFLGGSQESIEFDLKGTIAGGDSFGYIIIEERGKNKQQLYRLGDMIGSARLVKITRNTAIIKSGDSQITVKIKENPERSLVPGQQGTQVSMPNLGKPAKESGKIQEPQMNRPNLGKSKKRWGKVKNPQVNLPDSGMDLDSSGVQAPQAPQANISDPDMPAGME